MSSKVDAIRKKLADSLDKAAESQHRKGKLSFWERIETLADEGSFQEIGSFVEGFGSQDASGIARDAVMTGFASVGGKRVVVASQDFSQKGGTLGLAHSGKIVRAMDLAVRTRSPFVFIGDSGGARIQEGVDALAGFGDIFRANVRASGVIPQIAVILGPCAGGAVYSPSLMDFVFMVDGISSMFVTGPKVVREVTGEEITGEELGGARVHSMESGVCSFRCANERDCFRQVRRLISFLSGDSLLNLGAEERRSRSDCLSKPLLDRDETEGMADDLIREIIPEAMSKPYDVREVVKRIADDEDFLEIAAEGSLNIFTGFIRIEKATVGVIANNPRFLAGTLDVGSSCKAARFIRFCDCFAIPILTLVDVPGYMPGRDSERNGIIRHGAKMLYAYCESSVPKVTLIMRKAFGGAYIAMGSKHLGADLVFAYPDSQIAVMGAQGAVDILYSKEIAASADPSVRRQERIGEYSAALMDPVTAARRGYVDEIIDMRDTRSRIANAFKMLRGSRSLERGRNHGNIPL